MSIAAQIVAILSIVASLFLVTQGYRQQGLAKVQTVKVALIWAAIILIGTLVMARFAG